MKKRLLTGIVYIGIITGFFFLRRIHPWFFGILIYAFSLIGTFEMVRALNYRKQTENGELLPAVMPMSLSQKVSVFVYAASVPSAEKSAAAGAFDACADEAVSFEQGLCAQKAFGVWERSFAAGQQPSCGGLTGF